MSKKFISFGKYLINMDNVAYIIRDSNCIKIYFIQMALEIEYHSKEYSQDYYITIDDELAIEAYDRYVNAS
jgi:hypothetical protein